MKAIVTVGLKPGVLDVQGKAVAGALKELGFGDVHDARVGKVIEIQLDGDLDPATAEEQVKEMCKKIEAVTIKDLRRVAKQVFGGDVHNAGNGSGAPTVVLQEGEMEGLKRKDLTWDDIQARIARWKLGRR